MKKLIVFLWIIVLISTMASCEKDDSTSPESSGDSDYQLSIKSDSYWEYYYTDKPNIKYSGSGNTTRDANVDQHPTCITVKNTRSSGYVTASILKNGNIIDSGTSSASYGSVTVCSD